MPRPRRTGQILLEQIERHDEEQDVLHQETEWQGHDRKSTGFLGPAIGQEGNNARGTDEGHDRPKRAQDAKPWAPIAKENERAEDRFGRRKEIACAPDAEGWEQPEDDGAMAD